MRKPMSDEIKERMSAYLDEELEINQLSGLNRELQDNPDLRHKLNRYALISETLKGNYGRCNAASIAESVHQTLENEPTVLAPVMKRKSPGANLKTYLGGAAVAATVAALAVFNVDVFNQQDSMVEDFPVTVVDAQSVPPLPAAMGLSQRASTKWTTSSSSHPEIEDELNQFLIDHSEYTTQSGVPGLLPYATFVVYDKQ